MDVFATTFAPSLGLLATNAMYVAPLTAVLAARERGAMPMNALPFAVRCANRCGTSSHRHNSRACRLSCSTLGFGASSLSRDKTSLYF